LLQDVLLNRYKHALGKDSREQKYQYVVMRQQQHQ